ncbi:MAG: (2Fe-2S)-binding protein [Nitrososphaeria archaeon]|nr:(2Fe-2S)-binding protein [Conexivisphaerales archaeon]
MKEIRINVNGVFRHLIVEDNEILLDTLRTRLGITSVKAACWRGECGLCTVLIDNKPMKSCMLLSVEVDGSEILTAEGLYNNKRARVLMESFVKHGAMQCGFCTPAFVTTAHSVLSSNPDADDQEISEKLKGVICRCGTYFQIKEAVKSARAFYKDGSPETF